MPNDFDGLTVIVAVVEMPATTFEVDVDRVFEDAVHGAAVQFEHAVSQMVGFEG